VRVIDAKLKGKRPALHEPKTPQQAEVVDLMARLKASLDGRKAASSPGPRRHAAASKGKHRRGRRVA
ncbi:MAG: Ku protein, partial [Vicinamibacterales bacterium]